MSPLDDDLGAKVLDALVARVRRWLEKPDPNYPDSWDITRIEDGDVDVGWPACGRGERVARWRVTRDAVEEVPRSQWDDPTELRGGVFLRGTMDFKIDPRERLAYVGGSDGPVSGSGDVYKIIERPDGIELEFEYRLWIS